MEVNGKNYTKNWVSHKQLMEGSTINIEMGNTPNKQRGTKKEDFPYSLSNER
jgi:putative alpha-1,2-mannosidase